MEFIDNFFAEFVNIAWGWQTAVLLLGAGVYFSLRTKLKPFRYLGYAFEVLMGKHPSKDEVGEVSHFRACLLYTSPSPRDYAASRMPSSA